jgi:beta-N-acetylhexosaminidase
MLAVGVETRIPRKFREFCRTAPPGAVLLLGYNIAETPKEIMEFTAALQSLARASGRGAPFFIAVDHEGGKVYRFGNAATRLPGASLIGSRLDTGAGQEKITALYRNAASQLALLGFSLNLAPVLEPLNPGNSAFLGTRSYGVSPQTAARAGGIMIRAMREAGVLAAAKHFPGTGDADPHLGLPRLDFDISLPETPGLLAFREAVSGQELAALMVSHVIAPALDPERPVTLSAPAQSGFLRERMGFQGIILTDDINMKAVTSGRSPEAAAVKAVAAGADMIMYLDEYAGNIRSALAEAVQSGSLPAARLNEAVTRILEQKIAFGLWHTSGALVDAAAAAFADRLREFEALKKEGDALAAALR